MTADTKTTLVVIDEQSAGTRVDRALSAALPAFSRSALQKAIAEGLVTCNGEPVKKRYVVRVADRLAVRLDALEITHAQTLAAENIPVEVLYEDEHLIAVNKPAGMVVHPGSGNREGTLVQALLYHAGSLAGGVDALRPGIVHRLDKDTSGVLLAAKTNRAHAGLAKMFASRELYKEYVGFTIGREPAKRERIDAPVGRSRADPVLFTVRKNGKPAQTEYWTLASRGGVAILRFRLYTGRTHQIRVHCRHRGFPIVMDVPYGGGRQQALTIEPMQRPFAYAVLKCFTRQALHARALRFTHPITGTRMVLYAPLPEDFRRALVLFNCRDPQANCQATDRPSLNNNGLVSE